MEHQLGRTLRTPVRASLIFTLGNVLCRGVAVLATPLFTRILTAEEYGLYTLYLTWQALFTSVATLEVGGSVLLRGIQKHKGGEDAFLLSAFLFALVPFLLTALAALTFRRGLARLTGLSPFLLLLMFIQILASLLLSLFGAKCHYFYKPWPHFILSGTSALLSPALSLFFIYFIGIRAEARIFSGVILSVVCAIPALFFLLCKGHEKNEERTSLSAGMKFLSRIQLPLIPHYFSLTLIAGLARLFLSRSGDTATLAKLSVAMAPGLSLLLITGGINSALLPWIYRKLEAGRVTDIRRITEPVLILVSGVSALLLLICPEILRVLAPESWGDALLAVYPIALAVYPMFLYTMFASVELHAERPLRCSLTSMASAAIATALTAYLTGRFGLVGAAFSYLFSYMLLAFLHHRSMQKVLGKTIINVNNSLLLYAICFLVASLSLFFAERLLPRMILGFAICIYLLFSLRSFKRLITE